MPLLLQLKNQTPSTPKMKVYVEEATQVGSRTGAPIGICQGASDRRLINTTSSRRVSAQFKAPGHKLLLQDPGWAHRDNDDPTGL